MYEVREVKPGWFDVGKIVKNEWRLHSFHDNGPRAIRVTERLNRQARARANARKKAPKKRRGQKLTRKQRNAQRRN